MRLRDFFLPLGVLARRERLRGRFILSLNYKNEAIY